MYKLVLITLIIYGSLSTSDSSTLKKKYLISSPKLKLTREISYGNEPGGIVNLPSSSVLEGSTQTQIQRPSVVRKSRALPGIKARINPTGFQYLSKVLIPILNKQVKQAKLPDVSQCLPQVDGCLKARNLVITNYRCTKRVKLHPSPPDHIDLSVDDIDIGATGNLGGQITILVPVALFGILRVNLHRVSLRLSLTLVPGTTGTPKFQLTKCRAKVGFTDLQIEQGGLLGDIATTQLQQKISKIVRKRIPGLLCAQLPSIVDSQINTRLLSIPQIIPVTQLLQITTDALHLNNTLDAATNISDPLVAILATLDMSKLKGIYLNAKLVEGRATNNDFAVDLTGGFSPGGKGGIPFVADSMKFPPNSGKKMVDILISDWTINTLFYQLHKANFINVTIGPDTPSIGKLMKTTCEEDYGGLEDHGVETEPAESEPTPTEAFRRHKRQLDISSIEGLNYCLGEAFPALKDEHPNENVSIVIHSVKKAPKLTLGGGKNGSAHLEIILEADIHLLSSNEKVGTVRIDAEVDFQITKQGKFLSATAEIARLNLTDVQTNLGQPEDTLNSLGSIAGGMIMKIVNEKLETGIAVNVPPGTGGLPIDVVNPEVYIEDHAIWIQSDFRIAAATLAEYGGGGDEC